MADDKQLYQNGSAFNPVVSVIDNLTSTEATKPLSAKQGKELNDKKLNIFGEVVPGQPCRVPYYFEVLYDTDKATVKDYTIRLDNSLTKETSSMDIKAMDGTNAGLYTKALSDAKMNIGSEMAVGELKTVSGDRTATQWKITTPRRKLDNSGATDNATFTIEAMDPTNNLAGLYTKAMADAKTDRKTTLANGAISEVDNVPGQQGAMMGIDESGTTYANKIKAAVAVNSDGDGVAEIKAQIYAKNVNDNKGSRLNITQQGIYYTVGRTDATFDANDDEIAVIGDVKKKVDASVEYDSHKSQIINSAGNEGATLYGRTSDGRQVGITTNLTTGTDDILAQIYAKDSANKGARLAFTKKGAFYTNGKTEGSFTATDEIVVKSDLTSKMDKLPLETYSHTEYKFPFHIEAPVQNQTNITARFHTLLLNDGVTRDQYDIAIPAADITNDKAGLYTKALADNKVDRDGTKTLSTITLNGSITQTPTFFAPTGVGLAGQFFGSDGTNTGWLSVTAVQRFKDPVATDTDLPKTGNVIGDVREVIDTGNNWGWDGAEWKDMGKTVDLSAYQTKKLGTADRVLISGSDGNIAVSSITTTTLGYLDATSSIQTQLNNMVTKNSDITAGTKCKITYDAKGLVTGGSDLTATDIPTLAISKISGLQTALDGKVPKPATALTSATKCKITFDTNGLITAGADLEASDIPTIEISKINGLQDALDGKVAKNTSITGATKCKITYDAKGLVTNGEDLTASDIPNLASNKTNAMTGYTIGTSYSAIATSDTLNQAMGKVEYGLNNPGSIAKLTGYVIASAPSALSASMTQNEAFASLERRIKTLEDANLVRYG